MMRVDSKSVEQEILNFPKAGQAKLRAILLDDDFHGVISAADAQALAQQMGYTMPQLMLALLPFAKLYAIPPISNFMVGAIAQGLTGALYYGANLEFAGEALSFTVHAEQSATMNAWVNGEQGLTALAITDAPCGYCRQFLYEIVTADQLTIHLPDKAAQPLTYYLPDAFGPHDLGVQGGLMQPANNNLVLEQPTPDPLVNAALAAANKSYAPYTNGFAGVAVQTMDGAILTGMYAENAAFNPSMSPLEGALTQVDMWPEMYDQIARVVLVQARPASCSQEDATRAVLATVSKIQLEVAYAHPASTKPRRA